MENHVYQKITGYIVSNPDVILRDRDDALRYIDLELRDHYFLPEDILTVYDEFLKKQRVVCAANRFSDGKIILGVRHWDMFMHYAVDDHYDFSREMPRDHEQGFVDQFGNFLNRKRAMRIARRNGQIVHEISLNRDELFSENLY